MGYIGLKWFSSMWEMLAYSSQKLNDHRVGIIVVLIVLQSWALAGVVHSWVVGYAQY